MAVGKVGGGGRKGGAAGAKGGGGVGGAGKVSGTGFAGKVDSVEGVSGAAGSSNVGGAAAAQAADPVSAQAMDIARQLKSGQIKTKEEATKKLVADILKQKVRMQSKALTEKIADSIQDDPRLHQALERIWAKAE